MDTQNSFFNDSTSFSDKISLTRYAYKQTLKTLSINGNALEYARDLRGDKKAVLIAVSQNGLALKFALNALNSDAEVVLRAICQDGRACQYASYDLRADANFMRAAARLDLRALLYATDELKSNEEFIDEMMQIDSRAALYIDSSIALNNERLLMSQISTIKGTTNRAEALEELLKILYHAWREEFNRLDTDEDYLSCSDDFSSDSENDTQSLSFS